MVRFSDQDHTNSQPPSWDLHSVLHNAAQAKTFFSSFFLHKKEMCKYLGKVRYRVNLSQKITTSSQSALTLRDMTKQIYGIPRLHRQEDAGSGGEQAPKTWAAPFCPPALALPLASPPHHRIILGFDSQSRLSSVFSTRLCYVFFSFFFVWFLFFALVMELMLTAVFYSDPFV